MGKSNQVKRFSRHLWKRQSFNTSGMQYPVSRQFEELSRHLSLTLMSIIIARYRKQPPRHDGSACVPPFTRNFNDTKLNGHAYCRVLPMTINGKGVESAAATPAMILGRALVIWRHLFAPTLVSIVLSKQIQRKAWRLPRKACLSYLSSAYRGRPCEERRSRGNDSACNLGVPKAPAHRCRQW